MNKLYIGFLFGLFWGWLVFYPLHEDELTEAAMINSYEEGLRVGSCTANRLHLGLETAECMK